MNNYCFPLHLPDHGKAQARSYAMFKRPFAQLLPGSETGHPVTVSQSPAYESHSEQSEKETRSNNFRWLNAVKETKIEFFVRDNSGEKFLTAHAARRNFSEVICRACAVVVHSWFSHLHGKFCVLALRTFPTRPAPFELRIWLVGTVGSQRPVLILVFPGCMCRFFPSAGRARRL